MPRRSSLPRPFDHGEPLRWLGAAPLAGVFLALFVLAMSVYRTPTHALVVEMPLVGEFFIPPNSSPPPIHRIGVSREGTLEIDGEKIPDTMVATALSNLSAIDPLPVIVFEPHPEARYDDALQIMAALSRAGLIGYNFCFGGLTTTQPIRSSISDHWNYELIQVTSMPLDEPGSSNWSIHGDIPPHDCALWTDEVPTSDFVA